ncbi:Uncharacterized protein SCF082_LOCUS45724 [Durusdinium trenchii]|uniref:Uncharacterized protein n=1 Tax=Durusdinium trenchii TaxID=1381693 RepID=A0ABP0RCK1_9DINO
MQLRRAVSFKDATKVHQACGAFLFFLSKLQDMAPESEFINMKTELYTQFNAGLLDADLQHAVENHVPASADLCTVAAFRPYVTKIERGKTEDREQKVKELAQQVAAANLVHVKAQIAADTDTLRAKLPGKAEALAEHNLDMKYLRDRQTNLDVAV